VARPPTALRARGGDPCLPSAGSRGALPSPLPSGTPRSHSLPPSDGVRCRCAFCKCGSWAVFPGTLPAPVIHQDWAQWPPPLCVADMRLRPHSLRFRAQKTWPIFACSRPTLRGVVLRGSISTCWWSFVLSPWSCGGVRGARWGALYVSPVLGAHVCIRTVTVVLGAEGTCL